MADDWDVPVGSLLGREERMARYGGAKYGGIEPSSRTPNVFVYSDPSRGETYGYNFDGWNEDETVFLYTGEGRVGSQLMRDGNRAILEHREHGRALRLFVADGVIPGTGQRNQRYVGEFEVDKHEPYIVEDAPDQNGEDRTVFVFRLRPVGHALRRSTDHGTLGDRAAVTEANLVSPEATGTGTFRSAGRGATTATRREAELVDRYIAYLTTLGHRVRRWRIKPTGELTPLLTDIYDEAAIELYEAKGTATRDAIRRGIGQLLDYRRHIPSQPAITMLLPRRPADDLVNLLGGLGIDCVHEEQPGIFTRIKATTDT